MLLIRSLEGVYVSRNTSLGPAYLCCNAAKMSSEATSTSLNGYLVLQRTENGRRPAGGRKQWGLMAAASTRHPGAQMSLRPDCQPQRSMSQRSSPVVERAQSM